MNHIKKYLAANPGSHLFLQLHDVWWRAAILSREAGVVAGVYGHTAEDAIASLELELMK